MIAEDSTNSSSYKITFGRKRINAKKRLWKTYKQNSFQILKTIKKMESTGTKMMV